MTLGLSGYYYSLSAPSSCGGSGSDADEDGKEEKNEEREIGRVYYAITRSCGVNYNEEKMGDRLRYNIGCHHVVSIILSTLGGRRQQRHCY